MSRYFSRSGFALWCSCGVAIWLAAVAVVSANARAGPQAAQTPPPASKPAPAAQKPAPAPNPAGQPAATGPATFVGDKVCLDCHDGWDKGIIGTPHSRSIDPRTPAAKQGCESCHGAGSTHAQAEDPSTSPIKTFRTMLPHDVTATCATCHNRGEHALWEGSQHDSRGLTCTTCHSVHNYKGKVAQLKTETQLQLCATCHRDKVAKLDRSGHMPIREGKMQCSTCHSTHGSTNVRQLRKGDSIAELCTSCHADKRGPYLWEHAPTRDGCATCHDPHGSSNERMLVAKPPIFCQRCHVSTRHPSTIYDGAAIGSGAAPSIRIYARSCVTCHVNIHGSNHPSGQRFIR